jgi:hypothetical protein
MRYDEPSHVWTSRTSEHEGKGYCERGARRSVHRGCDYTTAANIPVDLQRGGFDLRTLE